MQRESERDETSGMASVFGYVLDSLLKPAAIGVSEAVTSAIPAESGCLSLRIPVFPGRRVAA